MHKENNIAFRKQQWTISYYWQPHIAFFKIEQPRMWSDNKEKEVFLLWYGNNTNSKAPQYYVTLSLYILILLVLIWTFFKSRDFMEVKFNFNFE